MFFVKRKIKVNDILIFWINNKNNLKIQSYQKYENLIFKVISPIIGDFFIQDFIKDELENFFKYLSKLNIPVSTQKTIFYILKSSWDLGFENKICHYINFKEIKFKSINNKIQVLSKSEQTRLEDKLLEKINIRKLCILLCLYSGLRIGEVCGLKWENINFNQKSLSVIRTIQRIKNTNINSKKKTILIEINPKSETSNRIVPIPDFIIELLKNFRNNNEFFILSNNTNFYDPRQLESCFERIVKNANIKYINYHVLRHTFATRCIESKMDIKTLSEILGHSSVEITLKLYVHPSYDLKKTSIENLVKFMMN